MLAESTLHCVWKTGTPRKHGDLSFYLWFVNQVHWNGHKLCCCYRQTRNTAGWGSVVSAAGWPELGEGRPFTQEVGHVCSLPSIKCFLRDIFLWNSGSTQETGFLILVLVNIFMRSFWENSTDSKSLINKREQGMLKLSHDHGYQMEAGGQWWNIFKCCFFICITLWLRLWPVHEEWKPVSEEYWEQLFLLIQADFNVHFICPTLSMTHSLTNNHLGNSTITCLLKRIRFCIFVGQFCQIKKPMQFKHFGLFSVCCYPLLLFRGASTHIFCIYFITEHSARSSTQHFLHFS